MKSEKIYEIYCKTCGAPAYFDIKKREYNCMHCGNKVSIDKVISEKKGFREIQKNKMRASLKNFKLQHASCSICDADVVFEAGDASTYCPFCGRSLVRSAFTKVDVIPELIIPFRKTLDEAKELLREWCNKNMRRVEAKAILERIEDLRGFYLPYELVKGPAYCKAYRIDGGSMYDFAGYSEGVFINCSEKLDNQLLDAMEPYDLDDIKEFDFAYIAGHHVKTGDIEGDELIRRIEVELGDDYHPYISKIFETKAVDVNVDASSVVRMPVLLPVYYLVFDGYMAAVNGQTGKVSVRAVKESKYIILPWWLKAILSTLIGTGAVTLGMFLCGAQKDLILMTGCILLLLLFIIFLAAYSQQREETYGLETYRKIYSSDKKQCTKPVKEPVFLMTIGGHKEAVSIRFLSIERLLKATVVSAGIIFFPVILALMINGFNFGRINLGGSAAWFCIVLPLSPVLLIKYFKMDLYDNPWIYIIGEDGRKKRYKPKREPINMREVKSFIKDILKPPALFLTLFIIMMFCAMVYVTAFGFV